MQAHQGAAPDREIGIRFLTSGERDPGTSQWTWFRSNIATRMGYTERKVLRTPQPTQHDKRPGALWGGNGLGQPRRQSISLLEALGTVLAIITVPTGFLTTSGSSS